MSKTQVSTLTQGAGDIPLYTLTLRTRTGHPDKG